jgi:hypothetical protein
MQYMLMEYVREAGWTALSKAEQNDWMDLVRAYGEALEKSGVLKARVGLHPTPSATTVRTTDGKLQVLDGPYADSKEQFAGYSIIDVPDLDAALAWASRNPTAIHGVVEIRPVWEGKLP